MDGNERTLGVYRSLGAEATEALGEALGRELPAGAVLGLDGELGCGKTCFVRGLARGLGVDAPVSSPTFALMNTYFGRLPLYHFDAWRTGAERAYLEDGGDEWLGEGGVAVVEWSALVSERLPAERLELRFEHLALEERRITIVQIGTGALAEGLGALVRGLPKLAGLESVAATPPAPPRGDDRP